MSAASSPKNAHFRFRWKLDWSKLADANRILSKRFFVTVFDSVPFYWEAVLIQHGASLLDGRFGIYLYLEDGPSVHSDIVSEISLMGLTRVYIRQSTVIRGLAAGQQRPARPMLARMSDDGQPTLRSMGITVADSLFCQISLRIPVSAFKFSLSFEPSLAPSVTWAHELFAAINNRERSVFSNAVLISNDDVRFYAHQLILQCQSEVLAAMLRHPPVDGQTQGEYRFPTLNGVALKALLEYLYTGKVKLTRVSTTACIALADAAEQYGLKNLKKLCALFLWKQAVAKPQDCADIIRFCDLHSDFKPIKQRAMAVLAENYETLDMYSADLVETLGGGTVGRKLATELNLFLNRRLEPIEFTEASRQASV